MAVRKYNPITPARRFFSVVDTRELSKDAPPKSLLKPIKKSGGRNTYGRVTARHIGGGHKRKYRVIDFKRDKDNIPAVVRSISYDPNRSARIALLHYKDGEKRYILLPTHIKVNDTVVSGVGAEISPGNTLPLSCIPLGTVVHNVELKIGKGGQLARSAGSMAQLLARENGYAHIRLSSGEVRLVHEQCRATVGQVGNIEHENISLGKAGRSRWKGKRPRVRGVAMNPVDHPLGGGEGKSAGGRHPVSPRGIPAKGFKTRRNKATNKFIIKSKKKK